MADNIVQHPHRDLMAEAKHERSVVDSPEAEKLKGAISMRSLLIRTSSKSRAWFLNSAATQMILTLPG